MELDFVHKPYAHCENGAIGNMLRFYGFELSEPLIFGLAYGLFFSHLPFVKLAGLPVSSFRTFPGVLFSRTMKLLGFDTTTERFLIQEHAMNRLNEKLAQGVPCGCVVGMYYLPYMPIEYRFPFNGHNICIFGHEEAANTYSVSDANCTEKEVISYKDLLKARYTKGGTYPLFGQMYWVNKVPSQLPDLKPLILKAIKKNCWYMTSQPSCLPYFGVNGIDYLAKRMAKWPEIYGERKAALNIAQLIRMLEEIGTGGAGFRFMYGAFLQQAAQITGVSEFNEFSKRITAIGDEWRAFAADAATIFKRRKESCSYEHIANQVAEIGRKERVFFTELANLVKPLA